VKDLEESKEHYRKGFEVKTFCEECNATLCTSKRRWTKPVRETTESLPVARLVDPSRHDKGDYLTIAQYTCWEVFHTHDNLPVIRNACRADGTLHNPSYDPLPTEGPELEVLMRRRADRVALAARFKRERSRSRERERGEVAEGSERESRTRVSVATRPHRSIHRERRYSAP
jgi:hypothetical protein